MSALGLGMPANAATDNSTSMTLDSNSKSSPRRRQGMVGDNTNAEVFSNGGVTRSVGNDKTVINASNLSPGIRGDTVLRRPKDLLLARKGIASNYSPRRRKSSSKREKSRFETILNILVKNLVLLAVFLWLGQRIWRWADTSKDSSSTPFAALDFEGRISEVETYVNKMTKMTQLQLEVMDERGKQIEKKSNILEDELKKLVVRADNLDKSLGELVDASFLSKSEFETFLSGLKERARDGDAAGLSLDIVRSYAKEVIMKEIEKHASDGLGRADYALAAGGGRVIRHSEAYTLWKGNSWFLTNKGKNGVHPNAKKMLEPSFGEPGQCFALEGSTGFVEIRLRTGILVDAFSLEHVAKYVAYDRSSAPKDIRVFGWSEAPEDDPSKRAEKMVLLGEISYDLDKSNAQTYDITAAEAEMVNHVRLEILSNHGSSSHTCIYRFRVHGRDPEVTSPASA